MHRPNQYSPQTVPIQSFCIENSTSTRSASNLSPVSLHCPSQQQEKENDDGFFEKLHQLLDESEGNWVSWNADGLSFQVFNPREFERILLPIYFVGRKTITNAGHHHHHQQQQQQHQHQHQQQHHQQLHQHRSLQTYNSFLGQLKAYGFHHVSNDCIYKDTFSHPLFARGKKFLLHRMEIHDATSLFRNTLPADSCWPLPMLLSPNPATRSGSSSIGDCSNDCSNDNENNNRRRREFCISYRHRRCRRQSATLLKQKKIKNTFPGSIVSSSSLRWRRVHLRHPIDSRLSFKETLLRRKRSLYGSNRRDHSGCSSGSECIVEDLAVHDNDGEDASFVDDRNHNDNDSPSARMWRELLNPSTGTSTSSATVLPPPTTQYIHRSHANYDTNKHQHREYCDAGLLRNLERTHQEAKLDDAEPLDHHGNCHLYDVSLQDDITKALATLY